MQSTTSQTAPLLSPGGGGQPAGPLIAQLIQTLQQLVNATNANGTIFTKITATTQLGGDLSGTPVAALVISTHLKEPLPQAQGGTGNATGSPSGAAGGDLGSTYPNPRVLETHLTAPLSEGQGGTGNTTGQPGGAASGDLGGTYPAPAVVATHLTAPLPAAQGGTGLASLAGLAALETYTFGAWTPVLLFGGVNVGMAVSTATGTFIQIGNLVVCFFSLTLTALGSSTGSATISGLPFESNADVANAGAGGVCAAYANLASLAHVPLIQVGPSASVAGLFQAGAAAATALTNANFTSTSVLSGSFSYRI
jgi:hypothetical protein